MRPFPNDPVPTGTPQTTPVWPSQTGSTGTPPRKPVWVEQNTRLPFGITPVVLDRSSSWVVLRLIVRAYRVTAWAELAVGIILVLVLSVSSLVIGFSGLLAAIYILIGTALTFLGTYATGELILVFLAIEKNTRKSE